MEVREQKTIDHWQFYSIECILFGFSNQYINGNSLSSTFLIICWFSLKLLCAMLMSTKLHPLRITDAHGKCRRCIISSAPAAAFSLRDCATNEQNKLGSSNKTPKVSSTGALMQCWGIPAHHRVYHVHTYSQSNKIIPNTHTNNEISRAQRTKKWKICW
jgi:hypothetical protein